MNIAADAEAFNLACLLIGLDPANAIPPVGNFDKTPAGGDPVALFVEWNKAGVFHSEPVGAFLKVGTSAAPTEDWVYIGSYFMQNGRYAAAELKNLIGFSHDRESIIQHRSGLGLEQYGLVQISDRPYDPTAQYTLRVRALAK